MKKRLLRVAALCAWMAGCLPLWVEAQGLPRFSGFQFTNKEFALTLSVSNGVACRIETSTNLQDWAALVTLPGTNTTLRHTDSAAPFIPSRFYRAQQVDGTNFLTGDHLSSS